MPSLNGPVPVKGESFVIVGANGAGKSQLGAWLEEQSQGVRQSHRVSAQRALTIQEFIKPLPREQAEQRLHIGRHDEDVHIIERRGTRWANDPVGHLLNDFEALLALLFAQDSERDKEYINATRISISAEKLPISDSRIDTLTRLWNNLMPHRQVSFEDGKVMTSVVGKPGQRYNGRRMSDGERVLVYLIGQALCLPKDTLFIIDEPEIHLHRAIRDKLWDALEQARPDCTFVYITHDLDFATSREPATILWVKGFDGSQQPLTWDWELCPRNIDLPTDLLLQVLGSRKPVLFVEGDSVTSLDAKLYKLIYPEHRVIAVGGSINVDRCVVALRSVASLHHIRPCGIVDRDHRSAGEIASLADRGVSCCPFAEIENFLLESELLAAVVTRAGVPNATATVQQAKSKVLNMLKSESDGQVAKWGEAVVAHRLRAFSCKETDPKRVSVAVEAHAKGIDVQQIYAEAKACIDGALASANYYEALRLFNNKGLLAAVSKLLSISPEAYLRMALAAIRENGDLRMHLARLVPLAP